MPFRQQGLDATEGFDRPGDRAPGRQTLTQNLPPSAVAPPEPEAPAPDPDRAPLIVADRAPTRAGQLEQTAFLATLRASVVATASRVLGPTWSPSSCPDLGRIFAHYAALDARALDAIMRRYARLSSAVSALEYVEAGCARIGSTIARWGRGEELSWDLGPSGLPSAIDAGGASSSSGAPLDGGTAARMGAAFGDSFADVRVHTDPAAAAKTSALGAHAMAMGTDIAFAAGAYQPGTPAGDGLIAHELAHMMQQRGGAPVTQLRAEHGGSTGAHERDADDAAAAVVARLHGGDRGTEPIRPALRADLGVQPGCRPTVAPEDRRRPHEELLTPRPTGPGHDDSVVLDEPAAAPIAAAPPAAAAAAAAVDDEGGGSTIRNDDQPNAAPDALPFMQQFNRRHGTDPNRRLRAPIREALQRIDSPTAYLQYLAAHDDVAAEIQREVDAGCGDEVLMRHLERLDRFVDPDRDRRGGDDDVRTGLDSPPPAARADTVQLPRGTMTWRLDSANWSRPTVDISFTPDPTTLLAANAIGFVQTVVQRLGDQNQFRELDAMRPGHITTELQPYAERDGSYVDPWGHESRQAPTYAASWSQERGTFGEHDDKGRLGRVAAGRATTTTLTDRPRNLMTRAGAAYACDFEAVAMVLETREPVGSLRWGFRIGAGADAALELTGATRADCAAAPSARFERALDQHYAGKFNAMLDGFAENDATLTGAHQVEIARVAGLLAADDRRFLLIGGAADLGEANPGPLSQRRATAAADALAAAGVPRARLRLQWYGADWARARTAADAPTPANRRAQIWLTEDADNLPSLEDAPASQAPAPQPPPAASSAAATSAAATSAAATSAAATSATATAPSPDQPPPLPTSPPPPIPASLPPLPWMSLPPPPAASAAPLASATAVTPIMGPRRAGGTLRLSAPSSTGVDVTVQAGDASFVGRAGADALPFQLDLPRVIGTIRIRVRVGDAEATVDWDDPASAAVFIMPTFQLTMMPP